HALIPDCFVLLVQAPVATRYRRRGKQSVTVLMQTAFCLSRFCGPPGVMERENRQSTKLTVSSLAKLYDFVLSGAKGAIAFNVSEQDSFVLVAHVEARALSHLS
ncbi:MAG: hypothetical protein AAF222_16045, partial [Pseudomonadota bacterium]